MIYFWVALSMGLELFLFFGMTFRKQRKKGGKRAY